MEADGFLVDVSKIHNDTKLEISLGQDVKLINEEIAIKFVSLSGRLFQGAEQKGIDCVFAEGMLTAKASAVCARCLEPADIELAVEFCEKFLEGSGVTSEDEEDSIDEAYSFDGGSIDLEPLLRDIILLNIPLKIVCGEECAGLCDTCGTNLNHEECSCKPEIHPALSVLRDISF